MTRRWVLLPLVLAILIAGCAGGTGGSAAAPSAPTNTPRRTESSPPAPVPSSPPQPAVRPLAKGDGVPGYHAVSVFYGTDRERTGTSEAPNYYGSQRGTVELGVCEVSIPLQHRLGHLETPFFKILANPASHVVLLSITRMDSGAWAAEVENRIQASSNKDAFVFIHGFNVTFEDACRRTAQLAYDLKFPGAPLMWSWPSDGKLASYTKDEAAVEWSTEHFRAFLKTVTKETKAQTVHLIAHSMGNRALVRALAALVAEQRDANRPLFNQVVLTAPDIDRDVFLQLADGIRKVSERTTLYASSKDKALEISQRIHGAPRAGEAGNNIVVTEGIDTIDVSAVDTSLIGHSYYGDKVSVITDLYDLLILKEPPDRRLYLQEQSREGHVYWEFRR